MSGNFFLFISTGHNQIIDILLSPDILSILAFHLFFMTWHSQNLYSPDPACGCAGSRVESGNFFLFISTGHNQIIDILLSPDNRSILAFRLFFMARHSQNLDPACGCAGSGVVSGNSYLFISTGHNQIMDILFSPDNHSIHTLSLNFLASYLPDNHSLRACSTCTLN